MSRVTWNECSLVISDNVSSSDNLRDRDEIIDELTKVYDNYSTHSMNESALFFQGEKAMLGQVVDYLKRIAE